jgi:hypothetical protein
VDDVRYSLLLTFASVNSLECGGSTPLFLPKNPPWLKKSNIRYKIGVKPPRTQSAVEPAHSKELMHLNSAS